MPSISSDPGNLKVLVSGANGYIASWVVQVLLDRAFLVRGTVRTKEKGEHLKEVFDEYGDRFEVAVIEDNIKDGAFDEVVKGVDAIIHTASPVPMVGAPQTADGILSPAIKGTSGILESAWKYGGSRIKRVLVLSSTSAIRELGVDKVFTEEDWNESSVPDVKEKGDASSNLYSAAKVSAERAAWDFYNEHKATLSWDLTVINPPFAFGPTLHMVAQDPTSLNTSSQVWHNAVVSRTLYPDPAALLTQGAAWVDVRDLAEAITLALEKQAAGGERIIVSTGSFVWQEWIDAARKTRGTLAIGAEGGVPKDVKYPMRFSSEKEKRILGIGFRRTMEETASDILAEYADRGW